MTNELVAIGRTKADLTVMDGRLRIWDRRSESALLDIDLAIARPEVRQEPGAVVLVFDGEEWRMTPQFSTSANLAKSLRHALGASHSPRDEETASTVGTHVDSPAAQSDVIASKPPPLNPRTCDQCGNLTTDTKARFCPQCAAALPEVTASDALSQVEALAAQLHELRLRVTSIQKDVSANSDDQRFLWDSVADDQKWKVTWGVWGRSVLIQIGLTVVLLLLLAAAGVAAT